MKSKLIVLAIVYMLCHSLMGSDDVVERVRREAPIAWKEYLLRLDALEREDKETWIENEKIQEERSWHNVYLYPNKLTTEKNGTLVSGANALYTFTILRKNPKAPWVVYHLEKRPPIVPHDKINFPPLKSLPRYKTDGADVAQWNAATAAIGLQTHLRTWLPSYFESPDFTIVDAVSYFDNGDEYIKITFEYEPTDYTPNELMRSGEVVLIPKRYWTIKSITYTALELDQKTRCKCTFNFDYVDMPNGLPVPAKIEHLVADYSLNRTTEYKWNQQKDIDQKMFTLSYYGLPEPGFDNYTGNRVRYILMTVGLILVIWGIIAKIRNRKIA